MLCLALQRQRIASNRSAALCVSAVEPSPTSTVALCERKSQEGRESGRLEKTIRCVDFRC